MTKQLTFQKTHFNVIEKNNQIWITASELAKALTYRSSKSVSNVYNRNKDEFSGNMVEVINSVTSGNYKKSELIFSLRGAHLIGMFARTATAKEFRRWVLDILDKETNPQPENHPQSLDSIITELSLEPNMTRYLITVDSHGAKLQPIDVSGKSLVDAEAARNLVRDMSQMSRRMNEMVRRMGVLSGDCDVARLDKPID